MIRWLGALFSSADGDNVITDFGANDTLKMTAGKTLSFSTIGSDVVVTLQGTNYTGHVTLAGAAGMNFRKSGSYLIVDAVNTITNRQSNRKVVGTDGADYIYNSGDRVTIQPNAGNDTIENYGDNVMYLFSSADGQDLIETFGANDTLRLTAGNLQTSIKSGNDVVLNVKGAKYSGAITLGGAASLNLKKSGAYIYADPVNYIVNRKDGVKVVGTDGRDYITNTGERVTIEGKAGNDTLVGSDFAELYLFSSAHGDNVITNFGAGDSLRMTAGKTMTYSIEEDDVVVTLKGASYTGSVRLIDAAGLNLKKSGNVLMADDVNYINNSTDGVRVVGTGGRDYIVNSGERVTIQPNAGNDTIEGCDYAEVYAFGSNHGDNVILNFGAGDTLTMTAGSTLTYKKNGADVLVTLKGANYTGTVKLLGASNLRLNKSGKMLTAMSINTIMNDEDNVKVLGTDGADYIINGGLSVTIEGKGGNDTLEGSDYGEMYAFSSADGDNVIKNFGMNDTLRMTAGKTMTWSTIGSDVVVTLKGAAYTGHVTMQGAAGLNLRKSNSQLYVSGLNELLNRSDGVKFTGTKNADYMINTGENVTMVGGAGADTLVGSHYGEVYAFSSADGNNVILNFGVNDTLKCTAGKINSYYADGADYVVNLQGTNYRGSVRLKNAAKTYDLQMNAAKTAMVATGKGVSTIVAQMPSDEYWFEAAALGYEDELSAIVMKNEAVDLIEEQSEPTLKSAELAMPSINSRRNVQ